jgi:hypothetical protein
LESILGLLQSLKIRALISQVRIYSGYISNITPSNWRVCLSWTGVREFLALEYSDTEHPLLIGK